MIKTSSTWAAWSRKITGLIPYSIYPVLFRRDIILFFYHAISDGSLPHIKHLYANKTTKMFEHDLIYLLKNYNLVSYDQLVAHRQGGISLKPNSAFISFDDGFRECFTVVRPLLLKYGIPCTFFITTDLIDNEKMDSSPKVSLCIEKVVTSEEPWRQSAFASLNFTFGLSIETKQDFIEWIKPLQFTDQAIVEKICGTLEVDISYYLKIQKPYMSREELSILASDGFTIGAHTKSHPLLGLLPPETIEEEIVESCRIIQEITRAESIPLAFPYCGKGMKSGLLNDIRTRNKEVGYLFGTDGIRQHQESLLERIWADAPETDGSGQSDLPELLYLAYQELVLDLFRNFLIGPKSSLRLSEK
jgi:peptidoglycan/xylan/chitin deacetylase (PgdA/CDA1 family)